MGRLDAGGLTILQERQTVQRPDAAHYCPSAAAANTEINRSEQKQLHRPSPPADGGKLL
jgi:hypothetical protein